MSRGKKIRLAAFILLAVFILTTEYKNIYEIARASSLFQTMVKDTVSENSAGEEKTQQDFADETYEEGEKGNTDGTSVSGKEETTPEGDAETDSLAGYTEEENNGVGLFGDSFHEESENMEEMVEGTEGNFGDHTISGNDVDSPVSENSIEEFPDRAGAVELGDSSIPTEVDEFITWYEGLSDRKVHIKTYRDWLHFQVISQKMDLQGYVFQIDDNSSNSSNPKLHNLTAITSNLSDPTEPVFTGIGSQDYPFKGTLTCYLTSGLSIQTSVPIFSYLSAGCTVSNLYILCQNTPIAALAANVTGGGTVSLSNITVCGTIGKATEASGGLFATIENFTEVPLDVAVSKENNIGVLFAKGSDGKGVTITGPYSGAIAGYTRGNVRFTYDGALYDLANLSTVEGKKNTGANGLLFGLVEGVDGKNPVITITTTADDADTVEFQLAGRIKGYGNNGGLIGYMKNATLDTEGKTVLVTGGKDKNTTDVMGSGDSASFLSDTTYSGVGGLIGILEQSAIVQGSKFEIRNLCVKMNYGCVKGIGGFIGSVVHANLPAASPGEKMFVITDCLVHPETSKYCHGAGGFVGYYVGQGEEFLSGMEAYNVKVQTSAVYSSGNVTIRPGVGGVIGLYRGAENSTLTISDWKLQGFMATAHIGGGTAGVVGRAEGMNAADSTDATALLKIQNGTMDSQKDNTKNCTYMGSSEFLIWDDVKQSGGVLGILKNMNFEADHVDMVTVPIRSYVSNGGVIGEIQATEGKKHVYLSNLTLGTLSQSTSWSNSTSGYGTKGLLFGKVGANTIVKLGGTMDFSNTKWYYSSTSNTPPSYIGTSYLGGSTPYMGTIAGAQEQSVIYIDTDCTYVPYTYIADSSDKNDGRRVKYVDEIGNFGGAYRNGTWGDSQNVFDGDTVCGQISKVGDAYQLTNVADLMRLAVAMNSEGAFGTGSFGDGSTAYETLLGADYVLTASTYDLTDTGIVSLQRTAGKGSCGVAELDWANFPTVMPSQLVAMPDLFTGSFCGSNGDAPAEIILNYSVYRQKSQGLFANVGSVTAGEGSARFANLKLTENIQQKESLKYTSTIQDAFAVDYGSLGGLSVYAQGNVEVENCQLDVNVTSTWVRQGGDTIVPRSYLGGLFGKYVAFDGSTLDIQAVTTQGTQTVKNSNYLVSQLIACVESPATSVTLPKINMTDIAIKGGLTNQSAATDACYLGGLIAVLNENQADGTNVPTWNYDTSNEYFHQFQTERMAVLIDGLQVSGFSVTNGANTSRSSGLLGFRWLDVDATLRQVQIGGADEANTLTAYKRFGGIFNEVCGRMSVEGATIQNTTIQSKNTSNYSALFVAEAGNLYLSMVDYVVDASTSINLSSTDRTFDEVAGFSKQRNYSVDGKTFEISESQGGVVSISTRGTDKSLDITSDDTYKSYQNGATYKMNGNSVTTAAAVKNNGTRYYYDIPVILQADKAGNLQDGDISTPEELMRWHLIQYARESLRKYFATDAERGSAGDENEAMELIRSGEYTISGTIDLNGYSYYPTTLSRRTIRGNGANILFYGQNIMDKEKANPNRCQEPYKIKKQQYMLHSGLFYDVTASNLSGLTLSGTVSETDGYYSGALICGSLYGVAAGEGSEDERLGYRYSTREEDYTNLSDITLDNLWIATRDSSNSTANWESRYYGLMISSIVRGAKVRLDKIRMTGYDVTQVSPTGKDKAARALIAVAGTASEEAQDYDSELRLYFTNMDIADVKDDVDLSDSSALPADLKQSTANDKVLRDASFICYYHYYEDSSFGIYTFTKADYLSGKGIAAKDSSDTDYVYIPDGSGYVTMGAEITEETEYIDEGLSTKILRDVYGFDNSNYKPYVYVKKQILINPKPGNITKGCGTYEDPYIIENSKQLNSIYFYLKNQTAQLLNWKVQPTGNDSAFCSGGHTETAAKVYGTDSDFPTREQMNQAYYLISPVEHNGSRVIDLSTSSDFTGFGSLKEPFVGVIIGEKAGDGSTPVIKLPGYVNQNEAVDSFGLVRYAKGCVVKDLTLQLGTTRTEEGNKDYYAGVKESGAAVFANVCGGDNVIDNVVVKGTLKASDPAEAEARKTAQIGGYVGCVDLGTVILRNITGDSLKEFQIQNADGESVAGKQSYMWTGGIIGRVKDGAVVYEGLGASTSNAPILGDSESVDGFTYVNNAGLKASPNYGILNAAYLTNCGKVSMKVKTNTGALTIHAENQGQLLLTAMALNSGSLTYVGETEAILGYRNGYGADSRCRNGQYQTVGAASDGQDTGYRDAITNDNLNGAQSAGQAFYSPYLLDYFTLSVDSVDGLPVSFVLFGDDAVYNNPATCSRYLQLPANQVTLEFASNGTYNMTSFKDSFRGIGAGYYKATNTFKGNVEGCGSTIQLHYVSDASKAIDNIGLFNTVRIENQSDCCYMKDLKLTGILQNADVVSRVENLSSDLLDRDSFSGKSAAGLIGKLEVHSNLNPSGFATKYNYSFENIHIKDMKAESQEYTGGLIGSIVSTPEGGINSVYSNAFYFKDCAVGMADSQEPEGEKTYDVTLKGCGDVGGIIGSYQDSVDVTFEECQLQSVDLQACGMLRYQRKEDEEYWLEKKVYPAAGGFVGRAVGKGKTITILGGGYKELSLKSRGHMGGFIGETESTLLVNSLQSQETLEGRRTQGDSLVFSSLGSGESFTGLADDQVETTLFENGSIDTNGASYNRTKYIGSFGGLVGFVSGPKTTIAQVTVTNLAGTLNDGTKDKTFIGGLIGRLYEVDNTDYVIAGCTIGSTDGSLKLQASAEESDTNRVTTGGLVGDIECAGKTKIVQCAVLGNTDGTSIIKGTDTAAGMSGLVNTYTANGKKIYYENCQVQNLCITGFARTAGVEGRRTYLIPGVSETEILSTFYQMEVTDCELYNCHTKKTLNSNGSTGYYATGGIQAYTKGCTLAVECTVRNVRMRGDNVFAAGGIVGWAHGKFGMPRTTEISVSDSTIVGACAGGIAGYVGAMDRAKQLAFSHIRIENNKVISPCGDANNKQYAGGIYGWGPRYDIQIPMGDTLSLKGNLIGILPVSTTIAGNSYAGGIAGHMPCITRIKTVEMKNNIISILDKTAIANDSGGQSLEDYLIEDTFGIWTEQESVKQVDASLVETKAHPRMVNSTKSPNELENYRTFQTQEETLPYIRSTGCLFGMYPGTSSWVTDVKVKYDTDLTIYRPATDVGMDQNTNLHEYRPRCHVVYSQYQDGSGVAETDTADNQNIAKALGREDFYQFGDLLKTWEGYQQESDKKYAYRLGTNYQGQFVSTQATIEEILSGTYYDETEKYRSIYTNEQGQVIPMLVYDNNPEGLDVMLNTVIGVLTNNGGLLSETNAYTDQVTKVTPIKMIVQDGVVQKAGNGYQPSIQVKTGENQKLTCEVNSAGYDVQTDSRNGTFTVLQIEYKWTYASNTLSIPYNDKGDAYAVDAAQTMVLDIPVYVEKVLEYQTHITGVQGAEYYLEQLVANGMSSLQTLRDTYTAYVEYDYNDAYEKYNSTLTKEICFKHPTSGTLETIRAGTKFVLIDITGQGHAYYYKVEQNTTAISLAKFQDSGKVNYQEKSISSLTGRDDMTGTLYQKHENQTTPSMPGDKHAMQQYLLLVDSSEVTDAVSNYAYELVIQPIEGENTVLLRRSIRKNCPQECKLIITEYQGISGKFDVTNTTVEGDISPESSVTMNLDYTISAPTEYWNYLSANKESALSQYLDVAIYLERDGQRVALPNGTQVIFNKGTEHQAVGVMQGNTILYQYKDAGMIYDLNELTGNVHITGTIELDFGSGDFSSFESGQYTVVLELLKTRDADFPMGGDVLDKITKTVSSTAKKNLGFALGAENLLTLGINGYLPEDSDSGIIDCHIKIDFSDYFNLLGVAAKEMEELEQKYFTVSYAIEKKALDAEGNLSYEPYTGDDVKVYFGNSQTENLENRDGSKVVYKFSKEYVKSAEREEKYVVSFPYTVKADRERLLQNNDTITNYRVVAHLYLSDNKPDGAGTTDQSSDSGCEIYLSPDATVSSTADGMEDFFIFTVAKIKTDLDIH